MTVMAKAKFKRGVKKFLSEDFEKDFPIYPVGILFMGQSPTSLELIS